MFNTLAFTLALTVSILIPFPQELRPRLPTITGNVDYLTLRLRMEQIDSLLRESGLEASFEARALAGWMGKREPSAKEQRKFQQRSRQALRCTVLRTLLQEDYEPPPNFGTFPMNSALLYRQLGNTPQGK